MKILAIRGRNLASLEGDFEIDFTKEPLLTAGIFTISGPTGAGKSTILDAMCLALFSRTPRTEQAKERNVALCDVNGSQLSQSDPRFILRRGTGFGFAEVDFVALSGLRYRARWAVSRARNKETGRLQNYIQTLHNLGKENKEKEEQGTRTEIQNRIIELIGLTFEQFTRSVLLAQNDFSTFLKAEQSDKASLLEKLTGTEHYSAISRKIYEKNAAAKEALDKILSRIQGFETLSEEEEAELNDRFAVSEKEFIRIENAKKEQQTLQQDVSSVNQQVVTHEKNQKATANNLATAIEAQTIAKSKYAQGLEERQAAESNYKSLQQDIQQARTLDVQLQTAERDFKNSAQQLKKATSDKLDADKKYKNAELRLKNEQAEIAKLEAWREKYKAKSAIAEQITALQIHLDAASAARTIVEKANSSIKEIEKEIASLEKQLASLKKSNVAKQELLKKTENERDTLEVELKAIDSEALDAQIDKLRNEREKLLLEQAYLETTGDIKELRSKLQDGQPCPVCGSVHHPFIETKAKLTPLSDYTVKIDNLLKAKKVFTAKTRKHTALQQQLVKLNKELSSFDASCQKIISKQQLATERHNREGSTIGEQTDKLNQSIAEADVLFGNNDWQKDWIQDSVAFRNTQTEFANQWKENADKLHELRLKESGQKAECDSLASNIKPLAKQLESAEELHKKNTSAYKVLQTGRKKLLSGRPADVVEQEFTKKMDELKERLKELLETQTKQSAIAEKMRGTSEQITKDLTEATAILQEKKEALGQWNNDFLASSGGETLDDVFTRVSQEKTELSFHLRTNKENKEKIAGMQREVDARRTESEGWAKLNELAGSADGAKFRRIAQGYTLDILLDYANVQLRELTHRYRLERVPETLALQVIDRDMCDEVRTVHSLSGGESFLVSLALALGLSSLSSNKMNVESLFIDEGFGSLDAETLRVAMDALESLRTQGRKIGVISHVQEMTERIPVRISVSRAGNGRSFIEVN